VHSRRILPSLFAALLAAALLGPPAATAQQHSDVVLQQAALTLLKDLKAAEHLRGRRIAAMGFVDAASGRGCRALSNLLAERLLTAIHAVRYLSDVPFEVVARGNLDAIETAWMLDRGPSEDDVTALLEPSDILLTGTWRGRPDYFDLTVKALEVRPHGTRELTSMHERVSLAGLSAAERACLGPRAAPHRSVPGPAPVSSGGPRVTPSAPSGAAGDGGVAVSEVRFDALVTRRSSVREAPNALAGSLGVLEAGELVKVTGRVVGRLWYRVSQGGRRVGYLPTSAVSRL
jgi:hypothetical protein